MNIQFLLSVGWIDATGPVSIYILNVFTPLNFLSISPISIINSRRNNKTNGEKSQTLQRSQSEKPRYPFSQEHEWLES